MGTRSSDPRAHWCFPKAETGERKNDTHGFSCHSQVTWATSLTLFSFLVKPPRTTSGLRPGELPWDHLGRNWLLGVGNCGAGTPPSGHSPLRGPVRDEMFVVKPSLQVRQASQGARQVVIATGHVPLRKGLQGWRGSLHTRPVLGEPPFTCV